MKKYFFFDIDGTLTRPLTSEVPESAREALRLLLKNGHFVAIATGRIQADAFAVATDLGLSSAVSDGGGCVTLGGEICYHHGLPPAPCAELVEKIDAGRHPWAAAVENRRVAYTKTERYFELVPNRYYDVRLRPDFDLAEEETVYKIFIACRMGDEKKIDLRGLPHVWLRKDTLLVEPTAKEKGIQYIMGRFGLSDEQIVIFGDGMNDRSMFRPEWMTVAMGNAKQALKEKAKYITTRADEDGIYNACRRFGWI